MFSNLLKRKGSSILRGKRLNFNRNNFCSVSVPITGFSSEFSSPPPTTTTATNEFSVPPITNEEEEIFIPQPNYLLEHYSNSETTTPYQVITPKYQLFEDIYPTPPEYFTIDCENLDLTNKIEFEKIGEKMMEIFDEQGVVHVKNTNLRKPEDLRRLGEIILKEQMDYCGGANPRKQIAEQDVYDVGAPLASWIQYHHEMQYLQASTRMIGIFCLETPSPNKGWTYLSDAQLTTEYILKTNLGQKLKEKGLCYVRNLTDRDYHENFIKDNGMVYNHWQDSFRVEEMELVEPLAKQRGLEIQWDVRGENRFLRTKFFISAFEYFEKLDKNILFGGIGDDFMWFDSWPGVKDVPVDSRPLRLQFGDGTDLTQEDRQEFVDAHDRFGFPIKWKVGDLAIVCNYRYAHGRPAIELSPGESRNVGILLGPTFTRIGHVDGKW